MIPIRNVISKSKYETALEAINTPYPGWRISYPDGRTEDIAKKECKEIDDGACTIYPFRYGFISERLTFPVLNSLLISRFLSVHKLVPEKHSSYLM